MTSIYDGISRDNPNVDLTIYASRWVGDNGDPVDEVPDRFQARYMYIDEHWGTETICSETIAEGGVLNFSYKCFDNLGFSEEERRALIAHQHENFEPVQSEEELAEILSHSATLKP